ncbi:splicing coactivator SRRM1 [Schizosaccharomyces octosporus yFS286]|uniref:Splicing coactivator SRRM1 n=1 Tax=Schizosaccharomyces octosporus (strain yFS286) TaxID=483514 RepID=S9QX69_SCHOY|nr:splicing coactivator SRRM1 [Schizosaccharomyces octosporus yFS286]EPX70910.1 splicing coactivator SRRM1 [Schizosaccharomyces octosporus yFS286]
MSGFYKGVGAEQETLYTSADKKLMRNTKFPPSFGTKVDMKQVNIEVLKPWIANRLIELIGFEDEVVIDFVYSMLEEAVEASKNTDSHNESTLDPKKVQLNLTGFLESKAPEFAEELWLLILSASQNPYGIPEKFIQQKKEELSKLRSQRDVSESEVKKEIDRSLHPAEERTSREDRHWNIRESSGLRPRREPQSFSRREHRRRSSYERERSPRRHRNNRREVDSNERFYTDNNNTRSYRSSRHPRSIRNRHDEFDEFGRSRPSERRETDYYSKRNRSRSPYESEEERFSER